MITLRFSLQGRGILDRTNASVKCLHFSMQEGGILERTNGKCRLHTLSSTCRAMRNIAMHLITLLNILLMPCHR